MKVARQAEDLFAYTNLVSPMLEDYSEDNRAAMRQTLIL